MWLKDPRTERKSVTLSLLMSGFFLSCLKLILSDMTIRGIHFEKFSGADFALIVSTCAGLYSYRKFQKKEDNETKE